MQAKCHTWLALGLGLALGLRLGLGLGLGCRSWRRTTFGISYARGRRSTSSRSGIPGRAPQLHLRERLVSITPVTSPALYERQCSAVAARRQISASLGRSLATWRGDGAWSHGALQGQTLPLTRPLAWHLREALDDARVPRREEIDLVD